MEEYLTITQVAERLGVKPKTIRNKIALGVFSEGVHYFRPPGLGTRFKWSAVAAWIEQKPTTAPEADTIPMARGYRLGQTARKNQKAA
jgi:excisionase family DNA binding protein